MQHDLKSPSKTEINYIRSRELEKNRYFVGKKVHYSEKPYFVKLPCQDNGIIFAQG